MNESRQSFLNHLEALRGMLTGVAVAWALGMGAVGVNLGGVLSFLRLPMEAVTGVELVTLNPMAGFWIALQVITLGGALVAGPLMLLHLAHFLAPALKKAEQALLGRALWVSVGLFLLGAGLGFFWILPLTLKIALEVQNALGFTLLWSAQEYFALVTGLPLIVGAAFCAPIAIAIAVRTGALDYRALEKSFGVAFVVILIIAAAITPTGDPITFLLLAGPLAGLYALAVRLGRPKAV